LLLISKDSFAFSRAGPGVKKGKGQVFYNLGSQFPAIAVVGLGQDSAGYNEQEDIHEGWENVRIAASGMLLCNFGKFLHLSYPDQVFSYG
jgi:hypothetical protein